MQVLAARAEVAERALTGPDAVRDAARHGERGREGEPAEQRAAVGRIEFLVVSGAYSRRQCPSGFCHT